MRAARSKGFTLVEIMIVVLIIGVLLAIAVPNFMAARTRSTQRACIANLRALDSAKELYTYRNGLHDGDAIDAAAAWADYSRAPYPVCPGGGSYTPGVVGALPVCSLAGASPPHVIGQ